MASLTSGGTCSPLYSSSFNRESLSMPERDVEDDQAIFSSLEADPLLKTILVMVEQSTTRRLSHKNSSFSNVISFCVPPKDLSKSTRQRMFGFLVSSCRAATSSNVPQRVSLAICLALSNDDSKLPQKLLFNSSSFKFVR
uniref:Uncharacterized protein n=1 Tax=Triticum urartu TaxID=4572 RepID=A0A8R7U1R3_TRIUA